MSLLDPDGTDVGREPPAPADALAQGSKGPVELAGLSSSTDAIASPDAGSGDNDGSALPPALSKVWTTVRRMFGSKTPIKYTYRQLKFLSKPQTSIYTFISTRLFPRFSIRWILIHMIYNGLLLTALVLFAKYSSYSSHVDGYSYVQTVACASDFMSETGCGDLNAVDCEPFVQSIAVRCPAGCLSQVAWSYVYVGNSVVQYVPFVVGENNTYRGDSWICLAAIHAGVLSNADGGCLVANLNPSAGETYGGSTQNGVPSHSFNSTYPATLSFEIQSPPAASNCVDYGFDSEGFFLPMLCLMPFLNVSRRYIYWNTLVWIYLYWTFVSPDTSRDDSSIQSYLGQLLPCLAVLWVLYKTAANVTLPASPTKFPIETSLLWIAPLWFGFHLDMLSNYIGPLATLSFSAKMFSDASSAALLIFLIVAVSILVLTHLWMHFRQDTLFPYIPPYVILTVVYFELPHILGLSVHLHHYLLALLLLPPTRVQSRMSLICSGLLTGLFVQGVLKYGFAAPFDTSLQAQETYTLGTAQTQWALTSSNISSSGELRWTYPYNATLNLTDLDYAAVAAAAGVSVADVAATLGANEFSLVVNDVQVYRGKRAAFSFANASATGTIVAPLDAAWTARNSAGAVDYYARVAPIAFGSVQDYGQVARIRFSDGLFTLYDAFSNN
ncbi:hypothetical protein HDU84_002027 [Entophlyctis sp. JEL0112]|nr:hypothetical protein HDU84_002027 [Entophlyctis sp. JEL0112]